MADWQILPRKLLHWAGADLRPFGHCMGCGTHAQVSEAALARDASAAAAGLRVPPRVVRHVSEASSTVVSVAQQQRECIRKSGSSLTFLVSTHQSNVQVMRHLLRVVPRLDLHHRAIGFPAEPIKICNHCDARDCIGCNCLLC